MEPTTNNDATRAVAETEMPAVPPQTVMQKIFSQPDWLLGLVLGGAATALILLVVIPQQEYAKSVRDPDEAAMARAALPLDAGQAHLLAEARAALDRGNADRAVQNLSALLAKRPEHQEARWLLAGTYELLGDQTRAARHYRIYLDSVNRAKDVTAERVRHAEERLGKLTDMP